MEFGRGLFCLFLLLGLSEGFLSSAICGDDFLISKGDIDYFRITAPDGDVIMCSEEANFCEMHRDLCPVGYSLQGYNLTSSAAICVYCNAMGQIGSKTGISKNRI
eukprot:TRINITY_DN3851_c1_g2_i1.p1 TRINITY_DN3851_c1_g2~~TRINITY_DN3851_c1_g2_i1.p1  ORF type:complete len:105 (+),score=7.43 TRINITY_DN3851_c1_g2_i1:3-317(+)